METLSKVIFYGFIPAIIVYFRVKKKYGTAFAIGMVATSLLLGLITSRTFMPTPADRFTEYINENRYEEAREQLRYIVQNDPVDVKKIDTMRILNPVMFERIRRELSAYYLSTAGAIADKVKMDKTPSCGDEPVLKEKTGSIENGMRLVAMAESLGADGGPMRKRLSGMLARMTATREYLEQRCSGR